MFWNRKNRRHLTLKTRIALSYALLFFTSCAIIFFLMVYLVTAMLSRVEDTNTRLVAAETELIYIMGPRADRFDEILSGKDYPAEDRAVLDRKFPGLEICYTYRTSAYDSGDNRSRKVFNTAFACYRDEFYEMRVQDDGAVYSRKVNIENHIPYLRRFFTQQLYARGKTNFFIGIFNTDGTKFLTTDMLGGWIEDSDPSGALDGSPRPRSPLDDGEEADFRFITFPLPDGRELMIGRSVKHQEKARTEYALLFFGLLTVVTLTGICAGWLLSLRFIGGIKRTTLAMNRISSGDYSYRIDDVPDGDQEIRELMETFNAMNARTEELLQELKSISDDVAHDLRTPLTRLSGVVELLLCDRGLNEQVRTACVSAAEEIARMRELIDVMMDITRTNSNPKEIHKTEVDLGRMLRDFCEIMQPAIEEKNLEFHLDLEDGPLLIMADKTKLQRVVSNLLENALKFTSQGWIGVTAKRLPDSIQIQVSDTGCGIPEADRKRVFERFFQGDASRNLPGNGLGLALVQAVVKAHGWQISLHSVPGTGTEFTISIPETDIREPMGGPDTAE